MPAGQPLEVLVGRRGQTYGVPATYEGDTPGRELTPDERLQVVRATRLVADAITGEHVRESELNAAVELLHRLSLEREGTPRLRLVGGGGQVVSGNEIGYRARLG